jgi:organic radical activating enzyme
MSTRYAIKEVFDTLQGEGARTGARSVFVRLAGCNLWDGHPLHREAGAGACARWCDTDFAKGKPMDAAALLKLMDKEWAPQAERRWCVLTGGEPLLQVDDALLWTLRDAGWAVAIETNGTVTDLPMLTSIDHLCVSPKKGGVLNPLLLRAADELKVVLPGAVPGEAGWSDDELNALAGVTSGLLFVQPQDPPLDPDVIGLTVLHRNAEEVERRGIDEETTAAGAELYAQNLSRCMRVIERNARWRLSTQVHKTIGLR